MPDADSHEQRRPPQGGRSEHRARMGSGTHGFLLPLRQVRTMSSRTMLSVVLFSVVLFSDTALALVASADDIPLRVHTCPDSAMKPRVQENHTAAAGRDDLSESARIRHDAPWTPPWYRLPWRPRVAARPTYRAATLRER